jgi:uncharacterized membrane protein HdeD (DUF308 family)
MAVVSDSLPAQTKGGARQCKIGYPVTGKRFDWLVVLASAWIVAGLFLDGWAHNTLRNAIETFFTPWHAVLYSGFAVAGGLLVITHARNVMQGYQLWRGLPKVYMLSLLGVAIFGLSGGADFLWHSLFGFEVDTEALLSPTHLSLAIGGLLIISGPFRAAWERSRANEKQGWLPLLPTILSLLLMLSVFTFFTQFSNLFPHANQFAASRPAGDPYFWDVTQISYVLIPAGLMMTFILLAMRRWTLPIGSLTLILAGNATLMFLLGESYSSAQWPVLVAALIGGVVADLLLATFRPSAQRLMSLRLFAFSTPFVFFLIYFAALLLTGGIWWRIHMWLGVTFLAGIVGLGLSFLLVPPPMPAE